MILKKMIIRKLLGGMQAPSPRLLSCDLEVINRKIFTDLRFVKRYPCKYQIS